MAEAIQIAAEGKRVGYVLVSSAKLWPLGEIPPGAMGELVDVANGCLFLASDESKYMTGSELVIDGGYTCR